MRYTRVAEVCGCKDNGDKDRTYKELDCRKRTIKKQGKSLDEVSEREKKIERYI